MSKELQKGVFNEIYRVNFDSPLFFVEEMMPKKAVVEVDKKNN